MHKYKTLKITSEGVECWIGFLFVVQNGQIVILGQAKGLSERGVLNQIWKLHNELKAA